MSFRIRPGHRGHQGRGGEQRGESEPPDGQCRIARHVRLTLDGESDHELPQCDQDQDARGGPGQCGEGTGAQRLPPIADEQQRKQSGQLGNDREADDVRDAPSRDVEDLAQHLVAVAHMDTGGHGDAPQTGRDCAEGHGVGGAASPGRRGCDGCAVGEGSVGCRHEVHAGFGHGGCTSSATAGCLPLRRDGAPADGGPEEDPRSSDRQGPDLRTRRC